MNPSALFSPGSVFSPSNFLQELIFPLEEGKKHFLLQLSPFPNQGWHHTNACLPLLPSLIPVFCCSWLQVFPAARCCPLPIQNTPRHCPWSSFAPRFLRYPGGLGVPPLPRSALALLRLPGSCSLLEDLLLGKCSALTYESRTFAWQLEK